MNEEIEKTTLELKELKTQFETLSVELDKLIQARNEIASKALKLEGYKEGLLKNVSPREILKKDELESILES